MGVGSGDRGPTWIFIHGTNIVDSGLKVLFSAFFCYFSVFFATFRSFFRWPLPGKFFADALAYNLHTFKKGLFYSNLRCSVFFLLGYIQSPG